MRVKNMKLTKQQQKKNQPVSIGHEGVVNR